MTATCQHRRHRWSRQGRGHDARCHLGSTLRNLGEGRAEGEALQTILIAALPRTKCQRHGVKEVTAPWADRGSRFTALFESLVISWLQTANVSAIAALYGLSWSLVDRIIRSAVRHSLKRQRSRLPRHLGVDETSQKRHEYVTVVCDQESGDVVLVADGRSGAVLEEYLARFDEPTRAR